MKKPEKSEKFNFKSLRSKLGENNKLTKAISVIFLILIMSGLFTFIIAGLYQFDLIKIPAFIQDIFFKPESGDPAAGGDDRDIYDFLRDNAESGGVDSGVGYKPGFTLDNIKNIIANIPAHDNLYLETEAKYYTGGKISRTEAMSLWKKGGKYKYTLKVNSELSETYINDSKTERIENSQTGSVLTKPASEAFSFDNIPHIQNINYYFNLLESGEIIRLDIKQNSDSNIAEIMYSVPKLDQWELIYISLDTGIVLEVRCFTGEHNDLFYECKTTVNEAYYDGDGQSASKSSIQDSLFVIKP